MPLWAAGKEEGTKEGLGVSMEGLHVAEKAGRFTISQSSQR